MRDKLALVVTVVGVFSAVVSALSMRDYVRLVDIVALFASGVGTGAGAAAAIVGRARRTERAVG